MTLAATRKSIALASLAADVRCLESDLTETYLSPKSRIETRAALQSCRDAFELVQHADVHELEESNR